MSNNQDSLFIPDWPAPSNVKSCITTRLGGFSEGCFESNNLAHHVADDTVAVAKNRKQLASAIACDQIQWLDQVHGTKLVEAMPDEYTRTADGCYSSNKNQVCSVMTADCLPVLLCNKAGTQVAAVHAGWRGLASGIVANALALFDDRAADVMVYLGPAISNSHFEVGIDVLEAFFEASLSEAHLNSVSLAFSPSVSRPMKYQANIYALAKAELNELGVTAIYGGDYCTYRDSDRFYSYRRDGQTGRFASLIWLT